MAARRLPSAGSSRARGQHFLRSRRVARELVAGAGVTPADLVVEIGAGTGLLTQALADAAGRVVALELDPALAVPLERRLSSRANVAILQQDVLGWPWPDEAFAVVANLPFAHSAAILRSLLDDPRRPLTRAELVVQWELARKRAAVWPSTLRNVYWGARYELAVVRHLARGAFAPPPTVDAGVLSIRRRTNPLVPARDAAAYLAFVQRGFGSQAPLRRALARLVPPVELKRLAVALGFAPDATARELDAYQWAGLFAASRRDK